MKLRGNLRAAVGSTSTLTGDRLKADSIVIEIRLELLRRAHGIVVAGPRSPSIQQL